MHHSIDYLRRQAKALKRGFAAGDAAAIARVSAVFPEVNDLRHTQALHVIAREQGFPSWPRLKLAAEIAAGDRAARAERLKIALYLGQAWVVEDILAADPDVADANLGLQVALYRQAEVEAALRHNPAAATTLVGVRSPLLHLAFSKRWRDLDDGAARSVAMAELLVSHGADVNDSYPAEPGSEHRLSALYGALGHAGNVAMAGWLLDRGATPDDEESLYHATELGHLDGVRLLLDHGARISGTNALPRILDFKNVDGVRLLLEHGADPNEAVGDHPSGQPVDSIPALHQAARRGCDGEIAALLLRHGADASAVWSGHTAYELACLYGNVDFTEALEKAVVNHPLSDPVAVLAGCAKGRVPDTPLDPATLSDEARKLLTRIILWPDRMDHCKALVAAGIDPNETEEMGMPPLHLAGWAGLPDQVAWLLTLAPDLAHVNAYGGDIVGTIIHGSENRLDSDERDHVACLKLVLEAGAGLSARELNGAMDEDVVMFLQDWAEAHPDRVIRDA